MIPRGYDNVIFSGDFLDGYGFVSNNVFLAIFAHFFLLNFTSSLIFYDASFCVYYTSVFACCVSNVHNRNRKREACLCCFSLNSLR